MKNAECGMKNDRERMMGLTMSHFSMTLCPHPNPLPKGEGTKEAPFLPRTSPLSQRERKQRRFYRAHLSLSQRERKQRRFTAHISPLPAGEETAPFLPRTSLSPSERGNSAVFTAHISLSQRERKQRRFYRTSPLSQRERGKG